MRSAGHARGRIAGLDGVRGLAALYVVINHIFLRAFPGYPVDTAPFWAAWFIYGRFAVVVFIVLSGLSLALAPARHGWRLDGVSRFARRRAWRILPPYWAALVFSLVVAWLIVPQPGQGVPGLRSAVVNGLLVQNLVAAPSPNRAFWSIAVEAQLYVLLPLLLLVVRRRGAAVMVAAVTLVVAIIGIAGPHVARLDVFVIQSAPDLAALFALGVLAGGIVVASEKRRSWPWAWLSLAAATPVLATIAWQGSVWTLDRLFWVDLALGPAIACLLAALVTGHPDAAAAPARLAAAAQPRPVVLQPVSDPRPDRRRRVREGRGRPRRPRRAVVPARRRPDRAADDPVRPGVRGRLRDPVPAASRLAGRASAGDSRRSRPRVLAESRIVIEAPDTMVDDQGLAHAFWLRPPGCGEIRPVRLPEPGRDDVLVRTVRTGVSRGTELQMFRGGVPPDQYATMRAPFQEGELPGPVKYGYLNVGAVEQGPRSLLGRTVFCLYPHQTAYVVPAGAVSVVPDGVPPARAVLAGTVETAVNALWDAAPLVGDRVAVVGAGMLGCCVARLLGRIPGVQVTLVDVDASRAGVADALGVDFALPGDAADGRDLVVHSSATSAGLQRSLELLAPEGTVIDLSWYGDRDVRLSLGGAFHTGRLRIRSSQVGAVSPARTGSRTTADRLALALDLLHDPAFDLLITGESPFADLPDVMARLAAGSLPALCHTITYDGGDGCTA